MSASKRRRTRVEVPLQERFCFTRGDVEAMQLSMNAFLLNNHPPEYRENRRARSYNNRVIGRCLWAIYTGRTCRTSSPAFLKRVYEAAWVAYENALRLDKSEKEAHRSAIVYAQLIVEQGIGLYEPPPRLFKSDH